tara:strand:+ start:102 stop:392 length:291 start_codon:yes stop_codon:yes gene_type:complete
VRVRAQQQMCLLVREALSVGKMAIAEHFFSTELALTEAKMRIRDELSSYCVVTEAPKTTFGKVRRAVAMPTRTPFPTPTVGNSCRCAQRTLASCMV